MIHHRTHTTDRRARNDDVAAVERTVLNQYRCNRTFALVELRLNDNTLRAAVRVRLQILHVGNQQNAFQQIINALVLQSRDGNADHVAAPFLGNKTVLGQLGLDGVGVRTRLIHLVDGNDNVNARRFRMVDRFNGLRHHAVVRRNNKDCNIGCHRASCTHGGERLVTGGVKEGDLSALDLDAVSADVLCDTARFARRDVRVADGVQNRGLAVVDVTHHADNGSAGNQLFLGVLRIVKEAILNADHHFVRCFHTEFVRYQRGSVEVDALVDRNHHAHHEELLHNFARRDHQLGSQLADQNVIGQFNRGRALDNGGLHLRRALAALGVLAERRFSGCTSRPLALRSCLLLGRFLDLLFAAAQIALLAVGNERVKLFIVFGKVDVALSASRVDYARTFQCAVGVDVGRSAAYNRLCLEGFARSARYIIALVATETTAAPAVLVSAAVAAVRVAAEGLNVLPILIIPVLNTIPVFTPGTTKTRFVRNVIRCPGIGSLPAISTVGGKS